LARATGEHFNIFQILGIGRREVTTHSPMLAELLNPKGQHGQGPTFLRLFLAQFDIHGFDVESDKATMKMEYHIGLVTEKSGGRIDIVVKDGNGATILIENKIGAGDQDNQMKRYREFDKRAHLFYLTLDGHKPSNLSEVELNAIQCQCISYAGKVLAWLKECRKTAACLPNVRETITQYIHLIEELTNQSTNILMNEELINQIVQSKESLAAFFTLRKEETNVEDRLIAAFNDKLGEIAKKEGLDLVRSQTSWREKGWFAFTTPALTAQNLRIQFEFERRDFQALYFGFVCIKHQLGSSVVSEIMTKFAEHFEIETPTPNVPAWAWWRRRNWSHEDFELLRSGQFAEDVKSALEKLAKIAKQVCPDDAVAKIG